MDAYVEFDTPFFRLQTAQYEASFPALKLTGKTSEQNATRAFCWTMTIVTKIYWIL